MRLSNILFLSFAVLMLFSFGCISQEYRHKILSNGSSMVEQTTTIRQNFNELSTVLNETCIEGCRIGNNSITLEQSVGQNDNYYEFHNRLDFPHNIYTVRLYRIPSDKFSPFYLQAIKKYFSEAQSQPAIDLTRKEDNKAIAERLRESQIDISYEVEMPADITSVNAGSYNPAINRKVATFNLTELLANSSEITLEAKELNLPLLFALAVLLVLLAISFKFFSGKKR